MSRRGALALSVGVKPMPSQWAYSPSVISRRRAIALSVGVELQRFQWPWRLSAMKNWKAPADRHLIIDRAERGHNIADENPHEIGPLTFS